MYLNHFSLARAPFDFLLEPDLTYWSPGLKALWTEVTRGLGNGRSPQFVVARPGCGKSFFLHLLALHSIEQGHNCAYIDVAGQRADLFESLSLAYGLEYPSQSEEQYLTWFESFLASSRLGGIQNVLLLDNVHRMDSQALQKLVYLIKIRIDNTPLLHVVATLSEKEDQEALELLTANQVSAKPLLLPPLDVAHTGAYITHRLKAAGHDNGDLFDDDVVEWLHARSRGIPREINYYADLFMTHAYLRHQRRIHTRLVQLVDPTDNTRKPKETHPGIVVERPKPSTSPRGGTSETIGGKTMPDEGIATVKSSPPRPTHERQKSGGTAEPSRATEPTVADEPRSSSKAKSTRGRPEVGKGNPRHTDEGKGTRTTNDTKQPSPPPPTAESPVSSTSRPENEAPAANRRGLFLAAAALVMLVLAGLVLLQSDETRDVPPPQAVAETSPGERPNTPIPVTRTPPAQPEGRSETETGGQPPSRVAKQEVTTQPVEQPVKTAPTSPAAPRTRTDEKPTPPVATPAPETKPRIEEPRKPATLVAKAEPPLETAAAPPGETVSSPPPSPRLSEAAKERDSQIPAAPVADSETEVAPEGHTPTETDSEFASFVPAPDGQDPLLAVQALDNLVHRFQWAYENADEHVLAEIFDPNIRTNENSGRDAILNEYGQFFRVTQTRRLAIGPLEWQTSGMVSTGVGRFTAHVVTKRGKERTFTGTLTIEAIATPAGRPKITALYYRYDS